MVVVFPTPFTPTTIITYGSLLSGRSKSSKSMLLFSSSKLVISSFSIEFNSEVPMYLSAETRFSMRSMIFKVVSTPTSDEIRISSRLSKTSSSTFDLPIIARPIFLNTLSLVFESPWSRLSFFLLVKLPKIPIVR